MHDSSAVVCTLCSSVHVYSAFFIFIRPRVEWAYLLLLLLFLDPVLNFQGSKNCAVHRKQTTWNGQYHSSFLTKLSCRRIALKCKITETKNWFSCHRLTEQKASDKAQTKNSTTLVNIGPIDSKAIGWNNYITRFDVYVASRLGISHTYEQQISKLECWKLTCHLPMWRSPVLCRFDRGNSMYEQQTQNCHKCSQLAYWTGTPAIVGRQRKWIGKRTRTSKFTMTATWGV